jgi:hypothetical protein
MPLSVLSALARLDVDPWEEAAELSELPTDTATQRLASLIARLPGGRWTPADARTIATRLIELLPRGFSSQVPLPEKARGAPAMTGPVSAMVLICAALVVIALFMAASREPSSRSNPADAPAVTADPPPTTLPRYR